MTAGFLYGPHSDALIGWVPIRTNVPGIDICDQMPKLARHMQHAAILHFVLGEYPVPDAFTPMTGARPLTDVIG